MTEDVQGRQRNRKRLWIALVIVVAILAVVIVPPLVSLNHYKNRITRLMAASLGRPVRMSAVELRLLPRPGFILSDLTVEEDPAYGAEPMLHANSVTASLRLLSLWRGQLEVSRISVDEASLNLVRTAAGRWNLDSFFSSAATMQGVPAQAGGSQGRARPFPFLEATNSRINIKSGAEKLPFSLVNTDLSFSQDSPGNWRIRLRGQPARTDLSLTLGDTGVVQLEGTVRRGPELRQMPIHLDIEWREAQLGQLTRLVAGSDSGWRGDLRGELHLDGTAEVAQIKTRLRATGVHREEFTPAAPMDFDANCGFVYHYSTRAVENLVCDSPLGTGRVRLTGDLPADPGQPHYSLELDRIPVAAGLDALRTVRSGLAPGLVAGGTVSGKITYAESRAGTEAEKKATARNHTAKAGAVASGPLSGSLTVEGFQLNGGGLNLPVDAPKMTLEPAAATSGNSVALAGNVAIPAGGASPLAVNVRLSLTGYQATVRGLASVARAKELAHAAGLAKAADMDALAGSSAAVDLSAEGPWLPAEEIPFSDILLVSAKNAPAAAKQRADAAGKPTADSLSGTVTLHNANWKADYLASHVEIAQATLHLDNGETRWDPVVFTYGPVKGTASLTLPSHCDAAGPCPAHFEVQFGDLDASTLQAAVLGAHEKGTLLSELINKLHPATAPAWPQVDGTVKADSLILGPVTLRGATATLHLLSAGAEITGLDAELLGGRVHGAGSLLLGVKPAYTLTGHFEKLNPVAVGQLVGERWSGGAFNADGKIDLSGYTDSDLAGSVKGTLHFEWQHGSVAGSVPVALSRFGRWTADAEIANHQLTLKQNTVEQGSRKGAVEGVLTLGEPPEMSFAAAKAEKPGKH